MTILLLPPTRDLLPVDEDELPVEHLWCCRPYVAMCGEDLAGTEPVDADPEVDDGGPACPACVEVDERQESCGAALCTLRSWWRSLRRRSS